MNFPRPRLADRSGTGGSAGRRWVRLAAFALLTVTLALVGQTPPVRGGAPVPADGVVDRAIGGDRGILPAKPSLRVVGEARGSRPALDHDPSIVIVSVAPSLPAPRWVAEAAPAMHVDVRPQDEGWTQRPRGPPTEQASVPSTRSRFPRMMLGHA
ncbi:hypothetical protein [Reyranella sp. CPCC 100927]|uniref:hypothetical protein n=1 Tax=Reyranella sp. CPCC 100927 TaxID=2599616 RepID=UPI0011B50189|nr:hypothetical protein [Reyranella sp. CPCC 100927]TWS98276.1 hypothetical protein FQU96_36230 [Reyranella sp. CPCC 100927]